MNETYPGWEPPKTECERFEEGSSAVDGVSGRCEVKKRPPYFRRQLQDGKPVDPYFIEE